MAVSNKAVHYRVLSNTSVSDRPYYVAPLQSLCLVRGEVSLGKRSPSF